MKEKPPQMPKGELVPNRATDAKPLGNEILKELRITPHEIATVAVLLAAQQSKPPCELFDEAYRLISNAAEWLNVYRYREIPSIADAEVALGWARIPFDEAVKKIGEHGIGVKQLRNLIRECFRPSQVETIYAERGLDINELKQLQRFHRTKREARRKVVNGNQDR
jgi:hypothetical protein